MIRCVVCNGSGWEKIKRKCAMYKNKEVETVRRCKNCGGSGQVKQVADGKSAAAGDR